MLPLQAHNTQETRLAAQAREQGSEVKSAFESDITSELDQLLTTFFHFCHKLLAKYLQTDQSEEEVEEMWLRILVKTLDSDLLKGEENLAKLREHKETLERNKKKDFKEFEKHLSHDKFKKILKEAREVRAKNVKSFMTKFKGFPDRTKAKESLLPTQRKFFAVTLKKLSKMCLVGLENPNQKDLSQTPKDVLDLLSYFTNAVTGFGKTTIGSGCFLLMATILLFPFPNNQILLLNSGVGTSDQIHADLREHNIARRIGIDLSENGPDYKAWQDSHLRLKCQKQTSQKIKNLPGQLRDELSALFIHSNIQLHHVLLCPKEIGAVDLDEVDQYSTGPRQSQLVRKMPLWKHFQSATFQRKLNEKEIKAHYNLGWWNSTEAKYSDQLVAQQAKPLLVVVGHGERDGLDKKYFSFAHNHNKKEKASSHWYDKEKKEHLDIVKSRVSKSAQLLKQQTEEALGVIVKEHPEWKERFESVSKNQLLDTFREHIQNDLTERGRDGESPKSFAELLENKACKFPSLPPLSMIVLPDDRKEEEKTENQSVNPPKKLRPVDGNLIRKLFLEENIEVLDWPVQFIDVTAQGKDGTQGEDGTQGKDGDGPIDRMLHARCLDTILDGKYPVIVHKKKLERGINIPELCFALIFRLLSPGELIQLLGRLLRLYHRKIPYDLVKAIAYIPDFNNYRLAEPVFTFFSTALRHYGGI